MRRREFLGLVGGASLARPIAVHAQTASTVRRIGLLLPGLARAESYRVLLEAFRQGLREYGWVEGQNVSVEYRFAEGNVNRLPELAVELVQLRPAVIVVEATQAIQAAKNATPSIPIVMATSIDPVQMRFVTSLARPGGNITGMALLTEELSGKRLQLLAEIVPGLTRVVALTNPANLGSTLSRVHFLPSPRRVPAH